MPVRDRQIKPGQPHLPPWSRNLQAPTITV